MWRQEQILRERFYALVTSMEINSKIILSYSNDYIAVSNLNPLEVLIYFWNEGACIFFLIQLNSQKIVLVYKATAELWAKFNKYY